MNQTSVGKEAKTAQKVRIFKSGTGSIARPVKVGDLVITPKPYLRVQTNVQKQKAHIVELQPHEYVVQAKATAPRKKIVVSNVTPVAYQSSNGHYTTAQTVKYTKQHQQQQQQQKSSTPYVIVQPTIDYSEYIVDTSQSQDTEDIYYNSSELESDTESIESVIEYLNATTALIETDYDGLAYRYRTILEDLLCLRNSFVRKTITHAIRQKLYFQTSGELLDVIFKSFEVILESVKIDQLPVNANYLQATVSFLAKIIETGLFLELIENKEETPDIRSFVTATMAKALDEISAEGIYQSAYDVFTKQKHDSYVRVLDLLVTSLNHQKNVTSAAELTQTRTHFWLYQALPLILHQNQDIQTSAIKAINCVLPALLTTNYQTDPKWDVLQNQLLELYVKKIRDFFNRKNASWHLIWNICVRLLDVQIPRSASTLNLFLSLVEHALRSNDPRRRAEGYICWRVLLEVLVRHQCLSSEKRLKLVCTPLRSLQARTADIARNKFHAWWYVICNVEEQVQNYIGMVFEPFLQFCFGLLNERPCLSMDNDDESTQVKNFPDVCLMAIAALIRIMGDGDKQTDEIFAKYGLDQPSHAILSPTIFSTSTAFIVINACAEASIMLDKLCDDVNNNVDCTQLAVSIWQGLFKHVNEAANFHHVRSIIKITGQLAKINSRNGKQSSICLTVCETILQNISTSFAFDSTKDEVVNIVHEVLTVVKQMRVSETRVVDIVDEIVALSSRVNVVVARRLLIATFSVLFELKNSTDAIWKTQSQTAGRFNIWLRINAHVLSILQGPIAMWADMTEHNRGSVFSHERFYDYLFWPLSITLTEEDFDIYATELTKTADLVFSIATDKLDFCKQVATTIKCVIGSPQYCCYINKCVAQLLKYAAFDFSDENNAPIDMLKLCECLVRKEGRNVLQDLNPLIEGLIKYRQTIEPSQYDVMAEYFEEILTIMKDDDIKLRRSSALVEELENVMRNSKESETVKNKPKSKESSAQKATRSSKRSSSDDFVVVERKWSLEPEKLTEHQREKMRSRPCDIPALYCDLSRSQDSQSVSEWAPKARRSLAMDPPATTPDVPVKDSNAGKITTKTATPEIQRSPNTHSTASTSSKRKDIDSDAKIKSTPPVQAAKIGNRRMTRELSRIQSESFNENLTETNRKTRSSSQKSSSDSPELRKTRSNASIPSTDKSESKTDTKKKQQPGTPATTPKKQSKQQKASTSAATTTAANVDDSPPLNGSTPKRSRQTRQSLRNGNDSLTDDQIVKQVQSNKAITLNNLELRVERLPEKADVSIIISKEKTETLNTIDDSMKDEQMEVDDAPQSEQSSSPKQTAEPPAATDDATSPFKLSNSPVSSNTVESAIIPSSDEVAEDKVLDDKEQVANEANDVDNIAGDGSHNGSDPCSDDNIDQSKMSRLFFEDVSHNRSMTLNDSKILTSPVLDEQKNLDFLNDTLNISPIISDSAHAFTEANENAAMTDAETKDHLTDAELMLNDKYSKNGVKDIPIGNAIDKMSTNKPTEKDIPSQMFEQRTPIASSSLAQSSKLNRSSMQSSTPTQAFSPVSSKFKVKMGGRGAQLLQMINRSPKPASPIPLTSNTVNAMTMMLGNMADAQADVVVKSEPDEKTEPQSIVFDARAISDEPIPFDDQRFTNKCATADNDPCENAGTTVGSNFLVFSKGIPSLQASPAVGILKRKHYDLEESTTGASPAVKRKRVSFNFPLIQTKEFFPDDEIEPFFATTNHTNEQYAESDTKVEQHLSPSKQSPSKQSPNKKRSPVRRAQAANRAQARRSPVHRNTLRNRFKRNQNRTAPRNINISWNPSTTMGLNQQRDSDVGPSKSANNTLPSATTSEISNASTDSIVDDTIAEAIADIHTDTAAVGEPNNVDSLLQQLLSQMTVGELLQRIQLDTNSAPIVAKKLGRLMQTDSQVQARVFDQLAESHAPEILEHALTENMCSTIIGKLIALSPDDVIDSITTTLTCDPSFAAELAARIPLSVIQQRVLAAAVTGNTPEVKCVLDEILGAAKQSPQDAVLPDTFFKWFQQLICHYKVSPEQYLHLTSIIFQKNPPRE